MATKRKHTTLKLEDKWAIIQRYERGETPAALSAVYGIGRATVYDIVKHKSNIEKFMKSVVSTPGDRKTLKGGEFPKIEEALYTWFQQQRGRNAPISGDILKSKARFFYNKINNKDDFRASDGWLDNFKSRYGIRFLEMSGEKLSADESEIEAFKLQLKNKIETDGLTPDQIYNADETGLNWRQLPTKSYVTREEKSASGRKLKKERLTLMPCTNASGTHKLKLLVVGKSRNPRCFKNLKKETLPIVYKFQNRAWVSREVFKEWYEQDFIPSVKNFLMTNKLPLKALLLLDNAPGHPNETEMKVKTKDGFIEIMFLPKNTTALIQPLDQNVIKTMKMHYKKRLLMDIVSDTTNDIADILKSFNIKDAVINSAYAWDQVSKLNIIKSWKNVWPTHPLIIENETEDETEYDTAYLDSLSTTCTFINKKSTENEGIPREDLIKWLMDADLNADLNDDEIVEEINTPDSGKTDGDENEVDASCSTPYKVNCDEAFTAAATLMTYCQERGVEMETIIQLKNLQERMISESLIKKKQTTLFDFFNV